MDLSLDMPRIEVPDQDGVIFGARDKRVVSRRQRQGRYFVSVAGEIANVAFIVKVEQPQ